jgi:hypothetical protein
LGEVILSKDPKKIWGDAGAQGEEQGAEQLLHGTTLEATSALVVVRIICPSHGTPHGWYLKTQIRGYGS